jgi:putative restriction endonuclease
MSLVQETPRSYRACPPLQNGDHLDAAEFMRRYEAMEARGDHFNAELINGIVYFMYPAHFASHGESDSILQMWLAHYAAYATQARHASNATVKLSRKDVPMPDGLLWDTSAKNASLTDDDYLEGSPELAAETSATSASYDTHEKFKAYQRAGIFEYIIWRTLEEELDWFMLEHGKYVRATPDEHGVIRSQYFQGLWLNAPALLSMDRREVLRTLDEGLAAQGLR